MSPVELIRYVVEYTAPRLRWLGWRRGIWQLRSIIAEALRVRESVFECRKERDEYVLKHHGKIEWMWGCQLPANMSCPPLQLDREDVHG